MEINIERIMDDIKSEIDRKGYKSEMLSFQEVTGVVSQSAELDEKSLIATLDVANSLCCVPFDPPLKGNPISKFFKKVIRKLIRFYIRPTVEQQNEFNAQIVRAANTMATYTVAVYSRPNVDTLESKLEVAELKLATVVKENEELRRRIEKLEAALIEKADKEI